MEEEEDPKALSDVTGSRLGPTLEAAWVRWTLAGEVWPGGGGWLKRVGHGGVFPHRCADAKVIGPRAKAIIIFVPDVRITGGGPLGSDLGAEYSEESLEMLRFEVMRWLQRFVARNLSRRRHHRQL